MHVFLHSSCIAWSYVIFIMKIVRFEGYIHLKSNPIRQENKILILRLRKSEIGGTPQHVQCGRTLESRHLSEVPWSHRLSGFRPVLGELEAWASPSGKVTTSSGLSSLIVKTCPGSRGGMGFTGTVAGVLWSYGPRQWACTGRLYPVCQPSTPRDSVYHSPNFNK